MRRIPRPLLATGPVRAPEAELADHDRARAPATDGNPRPYRAQRFPEWQRLRQDAAGELVAATIHETARRKTCRRPDAAALEEPARRPDAVDEEERDVAQRCT